jgi:replicative DNA helicase
LITESFLNACFSLLINKNSKVRRTKALYRDILEILEFTDSKETIDLPLVVRSKLDCLKKIVDMLMGDKTLQTILDSISLTEKFKQHLNWLDVKINEDLAENVFQDILRQVRLRKKINSLFENYDELSHVLDSIKDGSFDSIDDLVEDYEVTIKKLYSNMVETNRAVTIEAAASLDLAKDDYAHVIEMIKKKYERTSKTPSGFDMLDNQIMIGGYEPSRLYVYGGASGAGKSTILNNTIIKSATMPLRMTADSNIATPGEINKVYVYVTCENTIEEALMRTYMPMFGKTSTEMLSEIGSGVNIRQQVITELAKNGATIIMKYFPAMSIGAVDLMGVLDDAINVYGKDAIAGLYIDYLDLLKTDIRYDLYRIELGHITLSLKTLAVQYNIPIITGTQLGRTAYKITDSRDLGVEMISESIKKVEHADFVMLLAKDPHDENLVHGKIGKNRSGKSNVAIDFAVDFERFLFKHAMTPTNPDKPDGTTPSSATFSQIVL